MEGASNLVGLDLHLTKEKMRELFRALEEKKRVLELLDRFLEHPAGEIGVHVGLGGIASVHGRAFADRPAGDAAQRNLRRDRGSRAHADELWPRDVAPCSTSARRSGDS